MKFAICVWLAFFSSLTLAKRYVVTIDSIDEGRGNEAHLILLSNGQVGFLKPFGEKSLMDVRQFRKDDKVEIELDKNNQVLELKLVASAQVKDDQPVSP